MNNLATIKPLAIKPFSFVLAPVAEHSRTASFATVVAGQIVFFLLGLAVCQPLGSQMHALKTTEALTFAAYLLGGIAFTSALYAHDKKAAAAIVGAATLIILSFLGGLLLS
ncbi:MAG: hypothetical protein K2W95_16765 [Candidatus Obscuribacterales bacterium]|nr:hypothetical protein [Candidatus Obscuribacterales bacterium]